jgi:hypothetical protein
LQDLGNLPVCGFAHKVTGMLAVGIVRTGHKLIRDPRSELPCYRLTAFQVRANSVAARPILRKLSHVHA